MPTGRSSAFPSSRAPDGGRQKEKRGQVYFPPSSGARLERAGVRVDLPQAPAALGRAQWLASRPSPCRLPRFLRRRRIGIHFALAPSLGRIRMSYRLAGLRSEEHTSELQSLMRISYAVFCLKKNNTNAILDRREEYKSE